MQIYSDPSRESDPHALPDVEVFYLTPEEAMHIDGHESDGGWYWQSCFPGCLSDGDPVGPFATADEARADAQRELRSMYGEQ